MTTPTGYRRLTAVLLSRVMACSVLAPQACTAQGNQAPVTIDLIHARPGKDLRHSNVGVDCEAWAYIPGSYAYWVGEGRARFAAGLREVGIRVFRCWGRVHGGMKRC